MKNLPSFFSKSANVDASNFRKSNVDELNLNPRNYILFRVLNLTKTIAFQVVMLLFFCMPAMAQFTGYGDGSDGNTTPVSGFTDDIRAKVNGNANAGGSSIAITNVTSTFGNGKVVLIINMTSCTGGQNWEFIKINIATNTSLSFATNLVNTYPSTDKVQVIQVAQYSSLAIASTITCSQWNETNGTGGVLAFLVQGTLTINAGGKIDADGKGFTHIPVSNTAGFGGVGGAAGVGATVIGADAGDGNGWEALGLGSGDGASTGGIPDNSKRIAGVNGCCDCMVKAVPFSNSIPAFNASFDTDPLHFNMGGAGQSGDGGEGKNGGGGAGAGCVAGYPGNNGYKGADGGNGGNGAAGGGIILIKANVFINNGTITSEGDAGSDATNAQDGGKGGDAMPGSGAGGGLGNDGGSGGIGGSGGAGGLIYIISSSQVSQTGIQLNGGDKGDGGYEGKHAVDGKSDKADCFSACPLKPGPKELFCQCELVWGWINSSPAPTGPVTNGTEHIWTFNVSSTVTCTATTTPGGLAITCIEKCPSWLPSEAYTYHCSMLQQSSTADNPNRYQEDIDLFRYTYLTPVKQTYEDCEIINYSDDAQQTEIDSYRSICCPAPCPCLLVSDPCYPCPPPDKIDGLAGGPGKFGSGTEPAIVVVPDVSLDKDWGTTPDTPIPVLTGGSYPVPYDVTLHLVGLIPYQFETSPTPVGPFTVVGVDTTYDFSITSSLYFRVSVIGDPGNNIVFEIVAEPLSVVATSITPASCVGGSTGSIAIAVAGIPPYTYSWNTGSISSSLTNLSVGNYTVTVSDLYGHTSSTSATVIQASTPKPKITERDTAICGNSPGFYLHVRDSVAYPEGYPAGTFFEWVNYTPATVGLDAFFVNSSDDYKAVVTLPGSMGGCADTSNIVHIDFTGAQSPLPSLSTQDVLCYGESTGLAIAQVIAGGTPLLNFRWYTSSNVLLRNVTTISSDDTLKNIPAGIYTVVISNNIGTTQLSCEETAQIVINEPNQITTTLTSVAVTCYGGNDGSASVIPTGGVPPYSYFWNNGSNTQTITGVLAGTYSVTVIDGNGCDASNSIIVAGPPSIIILDSIICVTTYGGNNGSISLYPSGGVNPYSYSINGGANQPSHVFTGLVAGTYSVVVTDANGCSSSKIITVCQPPNPSKMSVAIYIRDSIMGGTLAGVSLWMPDSALPTSYIARDISDSIPDFPLPYAHTWVVMIDGSPAANFGHTVRWVFLDATNFSNHIILSNKTFPPTLWLGTSQANFECNDFTSLGAVPCNPVAPNGVIQIYPYPVSSPANCLYAVLISGGWNSTNNNWWYPSNLIRMYKILRTSGYSKDHIFVYYANGLYPLDLDNADGDNNVNTGSDITGAASKTNIMGKLNSLCSSLNSNTDKLFVYTSNHGYQNGNLMLWDFNNNGMLNTNESISPSELSTWTSNCHVCKDFYIFDQCFSGAFVGPMTGATHPKSAVYTAASSSEVSWGSEYLDKWDDKDPCTFSMNAMHQPVATYLPTIPHIPVPPDYWGPSHPQTCEGTPGNGNETLCRCCCTLHITCFGGGQVSCFTGKRSAGFTITGGIGTKVHSIKKDGFPYGNSQSSFYDQSWLYSNLGVGHYCVYVIDDNGCQDSCCFDLTPFIWNVGTSTFYPTCFAAINGSIGVSVAGDNGPFTYNWNTVPVKTTSLITGLGAGNYVVTITDQQGCSVSNSTTLTQPTSIIILDSIISVACKNSNTGSISLSVSGGTPPYTYSWSNGNMTSHPTSLHAGTYTVLVVDANGCHQTHSYILTQATTALAANMSKVNIKCGGKATGSINAIPTGGIPPYSYLWSNGAVTSSITNLIAGIYTCTISDAVGCVKTSIVSITQNAPLVVVAVPSGSTQATAAVSGGIPPYTYYWSSTPPQTTSTAILLLPGSTYKVRVSDFKNCSKTSAVTMPIPRMSNSLSSGLNITAFPNPAQEYVTLQFENAIVGTNYEITFSNMLGEKVLETSYKVALANGTQQVDIGKLTKGIYNLIIQSDATRKNIRLVIQ